MVTGALVFRWVWLIWMVVLAVASRDGLERPGVALFTLVGAALWTIFLSARRQELSMPLLVVDVLVCLAVILASAFIVKDGGVVSGRPFFASGYPLSAPLLWGAVRGPATGAVTAGILAVGHLVTRPLNGVPLDELAPGQVQNVTGAMLNYLVAGIAVGLVARLLWRSDDAVRSANEEAVKERERSARLAERDALARTIHDSVLQVLAMVHKRGKELAKRDSIPPKEVAQLAELAGEQEEDLRGLILREPGTPPTGRSSLRETLERVVVEVEGVVPTVSCVGPLWLPRHEVEELSAAVKQALVNSGQHASAERVAVFAEQEGADVVVSVRDDGVGFRYDESVLEADGKVGLLKSMKGRVEDLGGSLVVRTAPGEGTEVEFRIPFKEGS